MMNAMIFTEVHLLADKLILVVAIHSLGGSHANWHHTPMGGITLGIHGNGYGLHH